MPPKKKKPVTPESGSRQVTPRNLVAYLCGGIAIVVIIALLVTVFPELQQITEISARSESASISQTDTPTGPSEPGGRRRQH